MKPRFFLQAIALVLLLIAASHGQEWTRFRGPNGTGVADTPAIPVQWTMDGFNWRIPLPGVGHSSPVVWSEKLFITSADETTGERFLLCIDTENGQPLWQREFQGSPYGIHQFNSRASSTPTVDSDRLYFVWGSPEQLVMYAVTHDGNDVWSRNLGPYASQHGFGGSPILYGDLVILANDQTIKDNMQGKSSIFALDKATGEIRWVTPRDSREAAYSVPCILAARGQEAELVFNNGVHGIAGVDPEDGTVKWEIPVFDKRSVSSPVVAAGLVFGSCGSGGGGNYVSAVQPGGGNANRPPREAYRIRTAAGYVPTPVAYNDLLFVWYDKGVVTCLNAATGDVHWRERIEQAEFFGSPIRVADKLYCIEANTGDVIVLAASDEFKLLARNPLGEPSRATPAVSEGQMFLRTYSHLAAIGDGS